MGAIIILYVIVISISKCTWPPNIVNKIQMGIEWDGMWWNYHHLTCCKIGRMNFSGSGENLFCFRKSYKFCSSISNTKHVWFLCWKHSNARTKLNSSAFSWLRRDRMDTSIWPCRAYDGWFFRILMATMSLVPRFQHFTTWPNVPRPKNSST